jgi:hypothetical protein
MLDESSRKVRRRMRGSLELVFAILSPKLRIGGEMRGGLEMHLPCVTEVGAIHTSRLAPTRPRAQLQSLPFHVLLILVDSVPPRDHPGEREALPRVPPPPLLDGRGAADLGGGQGGHEAAAAPRQNEEAAREGPRQDRGAGVGAEEEVAAGHLRQAGFWEDREGSGLAAWRAATRR